MGNIRSQFAAPENRPKHEIRKVKLLGLFDLIVDLFLSCENDGQNDFCHSGVCVQGQTSKQRFYP